jgi:zinc/manganese transport system substrate-binding protein
MHAYRQLLLLPLFLFAVDVVHAQHEVVATTADVAALCRAIGGAEVHVTTLANAAEDPHFVDARPSMLRACADAEVLVEIGRELEIGWLPVLVGQSRNGRIQPGAPGRIDVSAAVRALGVPAAGTDRSGGDVHFGGNPHFLSDPLCGLQVARLLRDRFAALWPAAADQLNANLGTFRHQLAVAMVGATLAPLYDDDAEKVATLFGAGKLAAVLSAQGDRDRLGGWFGLLLPLRGRTVVADHDLWPYFTERFGLQMVGFFEPIPGVAPTTSHLRELIDQMRERHVTAILSTPYFAPEHAELVARATGAAIVAMAHQPGAAPGTDDYIAWIGHNVQQLAAALPHDPAEPR